MDANRMQRTSPNRFLVKSSPWQQFQYVLGLRSRENRISLCSFLILEPTALWLLEGWTCLLLLLHSAVSTVMDLQASSHTFFCHSYNLALLSNCSEFWSHCSLCYSISTPIWSMVWIDIHYTIKPSYSLFLRHWGCQNQLTSAVESAAGAALSCCLFSYTAFGVQLALGWHDYKPARSTELELAWVLTAALSALVQHRPLVSQFSMRQQNKCRLFSSNRSLFSFSSYLFHNDCSNKRVVFQLLWRTWEAKPNPRIHVSVRISLGQRESIQ